MARTQWKQLLSGAGPPMEDKKAWSGAVLAVLEPLARGLTRSSHYQVPGGQAAHPLRNTSEPAPAQMLGNAVSHLGTSVSVLPGPEATLPSKDMTDS